MYSILVGSVCLGDRRNNGKAFSAAMCETLLDAKIRPSRRTGGMNHLLKPDRRRHPRALPQERCVNRGRFPFRPAPDKGEIFLRDLLFLHQQTEAACGPKAFGDE